MQCKNAQSSKGRNSWSIFRIYSKVNQVIYSSIPICSPGFKALASIVFEIFCWQDLIHIFSKGHNSGKEHNPDRIKKYVSAIFSCGIHIWSSKTLAITVICYALKSMQCKNAQSSKGHNSWSIFRIYSKVNQVIYSSIPICSPGFKALASIVFEIFCWQDFIHIFSKGHNSGKGHNPDGEKYVTGIFSWEIHITMKSQNPNMHCSEVSAVHQKRNWRTHRWTDAHTNIPQSICPSNFA